MSGQKKSPRYGTCPGCGHKYAPFNATKVLCTTAGCACDCQKAVTDAELDASPEVGGYSDDDPALHGIR